MIRTQIYLTPSEVEGVAKVAAASGRKNSEVIREAIDEYLSRLGMQDRLGRLRAASGVWSDRDGVDLDESRREFDRF